MESAFGRMDGDGDEAVGANLSAAAGFLPALPDEKRRVSDRSSRRNL